MIPSNASIEKIEKRKTTTKKHKSRSKKGFLIRAATVKHETTDHSN